MTDSYCKYCRCTPCKCPPEQTLQEKEQTTKDHQRAEGLWARLYKRVYHENQHQANMMLIAHEFAAIRKEVELKLSKGLKEGSNHVDRNLPSLPTGT